MSLKKQLGKSGGRDSFRQKKAPKGSDIIRLNESKPPRAQSFFSVALPP